MGTSTEEQLTHNIASTRQDLSRNLDDLVDKVSPGRVVERRKEAVRGRMRRMRESVMGTAHHAADSTTSRLSDAGSAVSGTASGATDAVTSGASEAVHAVQTKTEGSPLAAGLVAFGAGALLAGLLPATQKEQQIAQQVVDTAKESGVADEAKSMGQEVAHHLKDHATEAAAEVKSAAQESAQHIKEEGRSSAETVREDTQSRLS